MKLTIFISYSIENKIVAGKLKKVLEEIFGFIVFVAHDDMIGSQEFQKVIIQEIEKADLFLPLLSEEFKQSSYCDQETGIAVCLKKKIFPIKLDSHNPYGFINKYHGEKYQKNGHYDNIKEICTTIALATIQDESCKGKAIDSLITSLEASPYKSTSILLMNILIQHDCLTKEQARNLLKNIKENTKVVEAANYGKFIQKLNDII